MKLREKPRARDRKPKSAEMLNPEQGLSHLREQLGLPHRIEENLRQFLESKDNDHYGTWLKQVELAALLTTLFPEEAEKFRAQAPVEKLVEALPEIGTPNDGIGMKNIKLIAPNQPLEIPERLFQKNLFSGQKSPWDDLIKLANAADVAILFPGRETDNKKHSQRLLKEHIADNGVSVDLLDGFFFLLYLDPALHDQIHEFVKSHSSEFESFFDKIRTDGTDMQPTVVGRYFATYKLCLAEEITQLPSGLLVAVEGSELQQSQPLPDRSMAA